MVATEAPCDKTGGALERTGEEGTGFLLKRTGIVRRDGLVNFHHIRSEYAFAVERVSGWKFPSRVVLGYGCGGWRSWGLFSFICV